MSKKPIAYIVGYGSLMYPSGINGRGMRHQYTWDDLQPVIVHGYRRGMYSTYKNILYYGVVKDDKSLFVGVLIPIFSEYDMTALLRNEGALPEFTPMMYKPTDITKKVVPFATISGIKYSVGITTLVNDDLERLKGAEISDWYVEHVWDGIQHWGIGFVDYFLKTGGVKYESQLRNLHPTKQ